MSYSTSSIGRFHPECGHLREEHGGTEDVVAEAPYPIGRTPIFCQFCGQKLPFDEYIPQPIASIDSISKELPASFSSYKSLDSAHQQKTPAAYVMFNIRMSQMSHPCTHVCTFFGRR
jgi:hypothetical protein